MYHNKKDRPVLETLQKLYAWADISEIAIQGIKPVINNLIVSYADNDELEETKNEEITFLLQELIWLEKILEEETNKNSNFELVIH